MITRNFNLYLNAGHSIPLVINANQAEEGEQWVFSLFQEDGTPYIPTDGSIVGIKSDGYLINNSGTVVDGKVVITETRQMTAAAGKSVFELRIDGLTHGTANFIVLVEKDPTNGGIVSDSDLSLIEEALSAVSPLPTGGTVGQVLTKTENGSAWSNAGTPTQEQVAEAVSDWADENITVTTGVVIDTSLAVAGAAADSAKVGQELSDLKSQISSSTGMSDEFKTALENLVNHIGAWTDGNSQTYITDLVNAMNPSAELTRISAVYTQSGIINESTPLESLKSDLVVTAHFNDSTSREVSAYTLSGTLTEGTSVITVAYGGKTTTFNVTVTHAIEGWYYPFNNSLLSAGTKDFGFSGVENYVEGVNGNAYYHEVATEGTSSTDTYGIKATGLSNVPDFSGDFTLSFWAKAKTAKRGHPFANNKYIGNVKKQTLPSPQNVASGWTVSATHRYTSSAGCSLIWSNELLYIALFTGSNASGGGAYTVAFPSSVDTTQWHHYALTRDNGTVRFFVDGNVIFTAEISETIYVSNQVCIGNNFNENSGSTSLVAGSYSDYVDDLYIAESCKWTDTFDPSTITY